MVDVAPGFVLCADGGRRPVPAAAPRARPPGFPLPSWPGIPPDLLWPVVATAAVALTGTLQSCRTPADLETAFVLFLAELRGGLVDNRRWAEEALLVLAAVMRHGQALDQRLTAIAESN